MISLHGFADDYSTRKDFIAVQNDRHEVRETILMLEKKMSGKKTKCGWMRTGLR